MPRKKSLYAIANERVSFDLAMSWAGAGSPGTRDRGMKATCPSCGEGEALRVYPDHGWCFSEQRYFTPVSLLAGYWRLDNDHAAVKALDKIGYVPPGYARLWDDAERAPEPALDDLAGALRIYCARICPDWVTRQYDEAVARALSRCLGVLPAVRTEEHCRKWLTVSKTVMRRVLSQP
jgi:hypothetical protein